MDAEAPWDSDWASSRGAAQIAARQRAAAQANFSLVRKIIRETP
jgi:hypothetical protein